MLTPIGNTKGYYIDEDGSFYRCDDESLVKYIDDEIKSEDIDIEVLVESKEEK